MCAISSDPPLPTDPDLVVPDDGAIDRLKALCARISPTLASSRVLSSQACFRPVTQDGLPLIGAVPGARGAYVATGHSVWGILNAPATGEAVADGFRPRSSGMPCGCLAGRNDARAPLKMFPDRLKDHDLSSWCSRLANSVTAWTTRAIIGSRASAA